MAKKSEHFLIKKRVYGEPFVKTKEIPLDRIQSGPRKPLKQAFDQFILT